MPFIDIRTPERLNEEQMQKLQVEMLEIISDEMEKGVDTIMVGIKDKYRLSIGRKLIHKGAFIDIKAFGKQDKSAKALVCTRINELLVGDFGFEQDSIYITFDDKDVWGYKGSFLS